VDRYFSLEAERDTEAIIGLFADGATVVDEGETRHGKAEIRDWRTGTASRFTYTIEILGTEVVAEDRYLVTGRLDGDFPGGTAVVRFDFTLANGLISRLQIAP
jgi:SnoaL-like domain